MSYPLSCRLQPFVSLGALLDLQDTCQVEWTCCHLLAKSRADQRIRYGTDAQPDRGQKCKLSCSYWVQVGSQNLSIAGFKLAPNHSILLGRGIDTPCTTIATGAGADHATNWWACAEPPQCLQEVPPGATGEVVICLALSCRTLKNITPA